MMKDDCDRKKVLINGREYYDPLDYLDIDFNDWSFTVKKKFDRMDKKKQKFFKTKKYNWMSKDNAKVKRAELKTKDLRRWGYNG